jgi:hypothetical protein
MKTGIPWKNLSIFPFTISLCSTAPAAAVMRGVKGAISPCAVATTSSRGSDQFTRTLGTGTEDAPTASSLRLMLESLGRLTTFQASASVSDAGFRAGMVSVRGTMDRLVREALGPATGRGIGGGISCIPTSDVGFSTFDDKESVDVA